MKIINKVTSTALAFSFLVACNFCLVECACASDEHHDSEKISGSSSHHHESENGEEHSNSDKHDTASLCCSPLIAVQNSPSDLANLKLVKNSLSQAVVVEKFTPQFINTRSEYKVEFPTGASPPAVFLLTHFNHAPPVSI